METNVHKVLVAPRTIKERIRMRLNFYIWLMVWEWVVVIGTILRV